MGLDVWFGDVVVVWLWRVGVGVFFCVFGMLFVILCWVKHVGLCIVYFGIGLLYVVLLGVVWDVLFVGCDVVEIFVVLFVGGF